jgi:hypothetical protein
MGLLQNAFSMKAVDVSGNALEGAKKYIYHSGTDRLAQVHADPALTEVQSNPVRSDREGCFEMAFLRDGVYRIELRTAQDVVLQVLDPVVVFSGLDFGERYRFATLTDLLDDRLLAYGASPMAGSALAGDMVAIAVNGAVYEVAPETEAAPHVTTAGGVGLYETGIRFSSIERFHAAVARGVAYHPGDVVTAGGQRFIFADDGNTGLAPLVGWIPVDLPAQGDGRETEFADIAALLASDRTFPVGTVLQAVREGVSYECVLSGSHLRLGGGTGQGLKVLPKYGRYLVEAFGATGDGVADDSAAFRSALAACAADGMTLAGQGSATYRLASAVTLDLDNPKAFGIDLGGATVLCDEAAGFDIDGTRATTAGKTLASEIARGDPYINLTDVTGIEPGDMIEVLSPALVQGVITVHHYYIANEIDVPNSRVYIEGSTVADVTVRQITDTGQGDGTETLGDITVNIRKLAPPVTVENVAFRLVNPGGTASFVPLQLRFFSRAAVRNCSFDGKGRFHFSSAYNGDVLVHGCSFRDFGYIEKDTGYANLPSAPGGSSFGYGVLISRTWSAIVSNCVGKHGWHTIDASRGAMHTLVEGCTFYRNGYAVSTHEGAWHVYVKGCTFNGTQGVTFGRNTYGEVSGCTFNEMTGHGISFGSSMAEMRILNNTFSYCGDRGTSNAAVYTATGGTAPAGILSAGFARVFEYSGNTVIGTCGILRLGFDDSPADGLCTVRGNTHYEAGNIVVNPAGRTIITGNQAADIVGQFMFDITVGAGESPTILIGDNHHGGGVTTRGGSALLVLNGSGTPDINVLHNSCDLAHLIRFNSPMTINNVIGNTVWGSDGRLVLNTGTIANALNNSFGDRVQWGTNATIARDVNNTAI